MSKSTSYIERKSQMKSSAVLRSVAEWVRRETKEQSEMKTRIAVRDRRENTGGQTKEMLQIDFRSDAVTHIPPYLYLICPQRAR